MKTITKTTINSVYHNLMILPGPLFSGFFIYIVLLHLFVPPGITVPISIIMSVLIFGLASYYGNISGTEHDEPSRRDSKRQETDTDSEITISKSVSKFYFVVGYIASLIIIWFFSQTNTDLFVSWYRITPINIFQLGSAIALCFFLPGYALVDILDRKHELQPILKILLSYIFSILVTGLAGYIFAASGFAISHIKIELVIVYSLTLIAFVCVNALSRNFKRSSIHLNLYYKIDTTLKRHNSEFIIFGSLFALIILSTYYLYGGVIIGDQWFHHGRSLMFISGAFKDLAASRVDILYPPLFSALLSSFFTLSGIPSVNAYVSIAFLNIIPVFAFYYFFSKWFPIRRYNRSPAIIACVLFTLSAGLGWAHAINMASTQKITSQISALGILQSAGIKTFDIRLPSAFIDVAQPDITTGLIIIGLPAGFVLLGMIKQKINNSLKYIIILSALTTVGTLFHDEFNLFIMIGCLSILVLGISKKNSVFVASLFSLVLAILFDVIFPGKYYTVREIFKIPLIILYISLVAVTWIFHITRIRNQIHYFAKRLLRNFFGFWCRVHINMHGKIILKIIIVSLVAYLYVFTFLVWNELSVHEVQAHTLNNGQRDITWYLYPMKLGVSGLLGIAFLLSYLFTRFRKEVFIFGIIAIISFLIGPYYDENRFSKYIMVGMVGLASLLIYRIIIYLKGHRISRYRFIINGLMIGLVVTTSSLSIILYTGYSILGLENPDFEPFNMSLGQRHFPSQSEMHMFNILYNFIVNPRMDNIAQPTDEIAANHQGLIAKLEGFSAVPVPKLSQSPLTLNASTIEGLYNLLNYSDSHYIILPKKDINTRYPAPVRFALQNFPEAYEDSNYIVLSVPKISSPSSKGLIGLIYQGNGLLTPINNNTDSSYDGQDYYHPYITSALALSNLKYDSFRYGDFSAFSKKVLVLTFDPRYEDNVANRYLEFVNKGGTLVVFNTYSNLEGRFSKLFSIEPSNVVSFNSIGVSKNGSVKVSGITNNITITSPSTIVKSFYLNNNQITAPFGIERNYGNGKIILVNAYGYFGAISKMPRQLFSSLENIPGLVDLPRDKYVEVNSLSAIPATRFIGEALVNGSTLINTSSIIETRGHNFEVETLSYKSNQHSIIGTSNNQQLLNHGAVKNILIKDLKLFGPIKVHIYSNGFLYSPSSLLHPIYNYFPMSIPTGFNMTMDLQDSASIEFLVGNNSQPVRINYGEITLYNIKSDSPGTKYYDALIKNPQINVHGNASFGEFYSNDPKDPTQPWASGDQLNSQGILMAAFDHVDSYDNASGTQYVTYLNQFNIDGYTNVGHDELRIPGDISKYAKEQGLEVPWDSIIFSTTNAKALATIVIITISCTVVLWPSIKKIQGIKT